jgi:hypothetical protein
MSREDAEAIRQTVMKVIIGLGLEKEQKSESDMVGEVTTIMAALLYSYKLGGDRVAAIHRAERMPFNPSLN